MSPARPTVPAVIASGFLTACLGMAGDADNCSITHNTFYNNDITPNGDEFGQIHIQFRANNCTIERDAPPVPRPLLTPSLDATAFHLGGTVAPGLFHELQQSSDLKSWISIPGHDSLPAAEHPVAHSRLRPLAGTACFRLRTR